MKDYIFIQDKCSVAEFYLLTIVNSKKRDFSLVCQHCCQLGGTQCCAVRQRVVETNCKQQE